MLKKVVFQHHNSAWLHTAAPSHYHSYRLVKDRQFSNTQLAKDTVHMWFQMQANIIEKHQLDEAR